MGDASAPPSGGSAFTSTPVLEGEELPSGTRVLIRGLLTRTDLNGRIGLISAFDAKKQRYELQAESVADLGALGLRVRPGNVIPLSTDPPTYDKGLEYGRLLLIKHHYHEAKTYLLKAMAMDEDRPEAYYGLSSAFSALESATKAAETAMCAMDRCETGTRKWALATAAAFAALQLTPVDELVEPDWWCDKELKRLSAEVVAAAYDLPLAHEMRATVLFGGKNLRWVAGERTPAELEEAGDAKQRAKKLRDASGEALPEREELPRASRFDPPADLMTALHLAAGGK